MHAAKSAAKQCDRQVLGEVFPHRSGRQERQVKGDPARCEILAGPRLLFDVEPTEYQVMDNWPAVIGPSPNPGPADDLGSTVGRGAGILMNVHSASFRRN